MASNEYIEMIKKEVENIDIEKDQIKKIRKKMFDMLENFEGLKSIKKDFIEIISKFDKHLGKAYFELEKIEDELKKELGQ